MELQSERTMLGEFSLEEEDFIQLSFASRQSESGEICLFFKKKK